MQVHKETIGNSTYLKLVEHGEIASNVDCIKVQLSSNPDTFSYIVRLLDRKLVFSPGQLSELAELLAHMKDGGHLP
jgi:hypothetical protein